MYMAIGPNYSIVTSRPRDLIIVGITVFPKRKGMKLRNFNAYYLGCTQTHGNSILMIMTL